MIEAAREQPAGSPGRRPLGLRLAESAATELSAHGATFVRLREWVEEHLTRRAVPR